MYVYVRLWATEIGKYSGKRCVGVDVDDDCNDNDGDNSDIGARWRCAGFIDFTENGSGDAPRGSPGRFQNLPLWLLLNHQTPTNCSLT